MQNNTQNTLQQSKSLLIFVFLAGFCSMLVEIAGARLISSYLGNTIYTWAATISLVLTALSIGYYYGGKYADRQKDEKNFAQLFFFAALSTLLIPALGNFIVPATLLFPLILSSIFAALILVPSGICYGAIPPFAIKLVSQKDKEGSNTGEIFAVSTIGSITGALGTGFILIPYLNLTYVFVLGSLVMLAVFAFFGQFRKNHVFNILLVSAMLFLSQASFGVFFSNMKILYEKDDLYYNIKVVQMSYKNQTIKVLFLDSAASSGETLDGKPAFEYVKAGTVAYQLVDAKSALVLGVAGATQIEQLKKYFPKATIDGVDIDPNLIEIAQKYFSLKLDNRTNITINDARIFVKTTDKKYDLVVMDTFRGVSLPPHLVTNEYFSELKNRINPNGLLLLNVISSLEGGKSGRINYMYNTISNNFKNVILLPLDDKQNKSNSQNILVIASDSNLDSFKQKYKSIIYDGQIPKTELLTDEKNPSELFVWR